MDISITNNGKTFTLKTDREYCSCSPWAIINCCDIWECSLCEQESSSIFKKLLGGKDYILKVEFATYFLQPKNEHQILIIKVLTNELATAKKIVGFIQPFVNENIRKERERIEFERTHRFLRFNVRGVTFDNDDGVSRQKILRDFKNGKEHIESIDLLHYLYEGSDAYYIRINGKIVGNLPSECIKDFTALKMYPYEVTSYEFFGGRGTDEHGIKKPFGLSIVIRFNLA